jgi:hypothetical protein
MVVSNGLIWLSAGFCGGPFEHGYVTASYIKCVEILGHPSDFKLQVPSSSSCLPCRFLYC